MIGTPGCAALNAWKLASFLYVDKFLVFFTGLFNTHIKICQETVKISPKKVLQSMEKIIILTESHVASEGEIVM